MPTMTVQSAAMRRLRRELENSRRMAALAPTGGVVKKALPPPQLSSPPPRCSAPTPSASRRADGDTALADHAARPSPAASCPRRHAAAPAKPADQADLKNSSVGKGAQVRVRTPVGTLRTGQRLVLWLSAVVVFATDEDGYLRVTYNNGKFPRGEPSGNVRVAKSDVKSMPLGADALCTAASACSSTVITTDCSAQPSQHKAALRPTIAGKKLPLLKKLEKEMQSSSKAIVDCW